MSIKKHSVASVFDALITQTMQRGGSPSVREINDAALAVQNLVAAATQMLHARGSESEDKAASVLNECIRKVTGE